MLKNARDKKAAIHTLVVQAITYGYGVNDWKLEVIQSLDKLARKQLCMKRIHAMKANVVRIYLPYWKGKKDL